MGRLKNFYINLRVFIYSIFHGMEAGNALLEQRENSTDNDSDIVARKEQDSVFKDFIKGEETQRVKETRDEMYRVLEASENLVIEKQKLADGTGAILKVVKKPKKKTAADYTLKINVYNPENLPIRLIQDGKIYTVGNSFYVEDLTDKYVSIFKIERDFIPRFKIENYTNKAVIRIIDDKHVYIDLYTTEYASQFGKVDALLIKQLYDIKKENNKKSDITTFNTFGFVTDKSAGEHSLCEFLYKNIEFQYINTFEGNFVITFKAEVEIDGKFVGDKFKTEELTKKLETHQKRDDVVVDADTLMRHIKQEENNEIPDYGTVVFKFKSDEEDSN